MPTAIVVAIAHVFLFHFFSLRCKSDDLCVACVRRDNRYVIIHRRGTEQEKQTLVSDAGGAIFPGRCPPMVLLCQYLYCYGAMAMSKQWIEYRF